MLNTEGASFYFRIRHNADLNTPRCKPMLFGIQKIILKSSFFLGIQTIRGSIEYSSFTISKSQN